jgi:quercetin dioxygenase-like cupin family protein
MRDIMRLLTITAMSTSLMACSPAGANPPAAGSGAEPHKEIQITRSEAQPSTKGPAEYFTGDVRVEGRFQREAPARTGGGTVIFEPGARTAWHTHPLGQTLIVTAGAGLVQHWGGPIQQIKPGDVVWIPPGVKHWHGATATAGMTHIAISESQDGKSVEWLEKVTDEQYRQ